MEKVSKIQIGCSKYDIQDSEARQLIQELRDSDILSDIDIDATVDSNTGTPNVHVDKGENSFTLNFTGLKGETGPRGEKGERGDRGEQGNDGNDGRDGRDGKDGVDGRNGITPHLRATASVGNTIGVPNVEVSVSGTDEEPIFNFWFNGIRGKDGQDGVDGTNGRDGRDGVDGRDGAGSSYDDTALNNRIAAVERDIINKWNSINNNMESEINRIVQDSEWLNTLLDGIQSQSNFGDDDVDSYLQRIGLYTKTGSTRTWAWSTIQQDVNALQLAVDALNAGVGTSDLTALESRLRIYIDEETGSAINNLNTRYARKDAEKILEWMYSELDQGANSEQTWNDLVSAAGGNATGALSKVSTNIKKLGNDEYLAKANLVSAIVEEGADITQALASSGVMTETSLDHAVADLFAKNSETKAAVSTYVGEGGSQIDLTADKINSVAKTTTITTSGLRIQDYSGTGSSVDTRLYVDGGFNVNGGGQVTCNTINCSGSVASTIASVNSFLATPKLQDSTGTAYVTLTSGYENTPSQIVTNSGLFKVNGYASVQNGLNVTGDLSTSGNLSVGGAIATAGNIIFGGTAEEYIVGTNNTTGNNRLKLRASDIILTTNGGVTTNNYISAQNIITGVVQSPSNEARIVLNDNSGGAISLNANVVVANGTVISSDESLKNIIKDTEITVESIASTRTVDYELKSNVGDLKSGAIAQDWQSILPNVVKTIDEEQHLGLDYSSAALVSAVVDAREIVKLKQENEELKQRLAAIEARLANI